MAVISAVGLHDPGPSRRAAREADRAHGRLRPRVHEAHHFDRGEEPRDALGEEHFALGRGAEGRSTANRARDFADQEGRRVSEEERPVRLNVVEARDAVGVPDACAPALRHEEGLAADRRERSHRRADAPRHDLARAAKERRRTHPLLRTVQTESEPSAIHSAASRAWYVRTKSAPARKMPVRISPTIRFSSIQPLAAAAFTIAYSPDTL